MRLYRRLVASAWYNPEHFWSIEFSFSFEECVHTHDYYWFSDEFLIRSCLDGLHGDISFLYIFLYICKFVCVYTFSHLSRWVFFLRHSASNNVYQALRNDTHSASPGRICISTFRGVSRISVLRILSDNQVSALSRTLRLMIRYHR